MYNIFFNIIIITFLHGTKKISKRLTLNGPLLEFTPNLEIKTTPKHKRPDHGRDLYGLYKCLA